MNQTRNGSTAGSNRPVKNTFKQGTDFTVNQQKNAGCNSHCGIIRRGAEHTLIEPAVAAFAEKKAFSRPEILGTSAHGRGSYWLMGLGAVNRKATGTAGSVCSNPAPPDGLNSHSAVSQVQSGTETMNPITTGQTAPTQNTDHHQTDLFFQASNHLAIALHSLRHATGDQGIKTAAGRANAAARALNQLAGGLSNV